mgnify:CR=1 FL=1
MKKEKEEAEAEDENEEEEEEEEKEGEREGGKVATRVPGGLAQACLSVPLPYNRGIRIMVWVKGRPRMVQCERGTRGRRSEGEGHKYRGAGSSGVETGQFRTPLLHQDQSRRASSNRAKLSLALLARRLAGLFFRSFSLDPLPPDGTMISDRTARASGM